MDVRTDQEIISLILHGEVHLFRHIVTRHQLMAYRTAFSVTRNHEDAQEVTQDSFMKAFASLHSFQGRSRFSTWLFRIVYHKALNHLESSNSYKKHIELGDTINMDNYFTDDSFQALIGKDQVNYIGKALDQLSSEDRVALTLYYLDEQSQQEISTITGWNLASTKQRIHRARARLDQALNKILNIEKNNLL